MTFKGTILGGFVLLAITFGLTYSGWEIRGSDRSQFCYARGRPVHPQTRTTGLLGGKKELFCCPTCALTEHLQTGKRVKITELSDFNTRARLAPGNAFIVSRSDVNECVTDHMLISQNMQINSMDFDRCSPSVIAFAHREDAERFEKEHGGALMSFEALAPAYQH